MSVTIVLGYDGSESAERRARSETIVRAKQRSAKVVVVFGFYISAAGVELAAARFARRWKQVGSNALSSGRWPISRRPGSRRRVATRRGESPRTR